MLKVDVGDVVAGLVVVLNAIGSGGRHVPFFVRLRNVRDDVVHGRKGISQIYATDRGFWGSPYYLNENIVSILPWLASMIANTIAISLIIRKGSASAGSIE